MVVTMPNKRLVLDTCIDEFYITVSKRLKKELFDIDEFRVKAIAKFLCIKEIEKILKISPLWICVLEEKLELEIVEKPFFQLEYNEFLQILYSFLREDTFFTEFEDAYFSSTNDSYLFNLYTNKKKDLLPHA